MTLARTRFSLSPAAVVHMLGAILCLFAFACTPSSDTPAPQSRATQSPATQSEATAPASAIEPDAVASLRLVSLGGPVTETLFALGLGERVVGVDSSSQWPEPVQALPQVGYHRRVSAEGVLALDPTHLLITAEAGPDHAIEQLRQAGVAVVDAGEAHTLEAAHARIDRLAEAFGRSAEAEAIHASIRETLAELPTRVREASPSVLFVYARGPGMVLVAGADTGPASLLEAAGARNAGASFSSFVPLTAEAVVAADPDILLMPVDGLESVGGPQGLGSLPGVAQTRAWQRGAVATVDDALIQAFGPRVGDAVAAIESALAAHLPAPSVSAR